MGRGEAGGAGEAMASWKRARATARHAFTS